MLATKICPAIASLALVLLLITFLIPSASTADSTPSYAINNGNASITDWSVTNFSTTEPVPQFVSANTSSLTANKSIASTNLSPNLAQVTKSTEPAGTLSALWSPIVPTTTSTPLPTIPATSTTSSINASQYSTLSSINSNAPTTISYQPLATSDATITATTSTTTNVTLTSLQANESFRHDKSTFLPPYDDDDSLESPSSIIDITSLNNTGSTTTTTMATSISPISTNQNLNASTSKINQGANQSWGSVHPLLIYSVRHEIKSYDLSNFSTRSASNGFSMNSVGSINTSNNNNSQQTIYDQHHHNSKYSKTLIAGLKNTIALDFYYSDSGSYIFWTDVVEERIYKGTIINGTITNMDIVVQTGLATAEGLAIDWVGHNIYWVESTLDHIEVANMNGSCRRTLIAGDMESPRAIAVDPRYGLLFWTDWDKNSPRIERSTMSGEDRKTLVHIKEVKGGWPNGLTLDYEHMKIYWIDAGSDSIHFVDYEGKNHQPLFSKKQQIKSLGHPFAITLFENNLYWTDWTTNSISMTNKFNGSETVKELQRLTTRLFDIKVFHPSRQPKVESSLNPCYSNNGNCSHFCLLSVNHTRKCDCPHLMKLAYDGMTCEADEFVLLIGRNNEIRAVDIDEPLHHIMAPISVPKVFSPKQFEYDAKSKTIFWTDSQSNEVKKAQLAGNSIDTVIDVIIESPSGLALDWISGNIYVTSASQHKSSGKIFISNLNGEYISILMDGSQDIVSPKSLAVHPTLGLLFCIDEDELSAPIIFVASMDGKKKRIIASNSNNPKLENPSSLAIDYELHRVYWINQANNALDNASIQYYDIVADRIVTILDESEIQVGHKMNPNLLCVDGDYLIISGRMPTEVIVKMHKDNLSDRTILKTQNMDQFTALRVYNASAQVGTNACSKNNGGCSQLCVPTNSTHRACKCTMGFSINPFNETECTGKDLFLIFSYNLGMKGISLEPESSPEDYYLPPIHKAFRASSIDYVHRDNLIYWVDNEEGSITKINRDTTSYQVIVQNLESEESIGIDWVAGNIYWLDPYYDIIEVARLNGSNRYVIVSGDMDKANSIVVNPIVGYIAWSDIGAYPKIETAQLDGSNRRVIVNSNLTHIDDIAIDYVGNYIYWVDSTLGLIERVKDDGSGRQLIYSNGPNHGSHSHLISIALYKDHLFIADSLQNQGSIIRCDKNIASNCPLIQQHLGDGIRDITVFAEQIMPASEENPCVKNNGGCQDLCLFTGKRAKRRCICSHGKLNNDGMTCRPYDTFVMFSKLSQIDSLHIKDDESFNNSPYPPIMIDNRGSIISLTVDYNAQRIIYSEISRDQICSVLFNGTDRKVLVERQSMVEGIAFANDQLYWTSVQDNTISRLNTTSVGVPKKSCYGMNCKTAGIEKIIRLAEDDRPRGIAVDTCTSYIYWTNWNTNASIQRASPHTGYKIESIIKTSIKVPNGIAIDHIARKLYWCDARLDKIETCDMDGTNRKVLSLARPQHPFALAIWENYVFWTDWLARGVFRADKYTGQQPELVKKASQRPMGITVAAPDVFECPIDHCSVNNGGCPPGYHCVSHDSGSANLSGGSMVECSPSHELRESRPRCKNGRHCDPLNYHDIIMNSMERFNLTDLVPIESKKSTLSSIVWETSTESFSPADIKPGVRILPYSNNQQTNNSTLAIMVQRNNVSTSSNAPKSNDVSSSITPSPDVKELISEKTASVNHEQTVINAAPVSNSTAQFPMAGTSELPPTSASSQTEIMKQPTTSTTMSPPPQAPLTNTSLPPCQIVPAALQPTTSDTTLTSECKGQFKCYLSEKLVCIPAERRCDGNYDCPSKEDENDCSLGPKRGPYNLKRETNWHRFVTVILIILAAATAALFLVFGNRGRRRWFVNTGGAFNHRRMFDDNGTNIEISNPMFDEDDSGNLVHCAFSIDLNERTTNFSNPLYERQFLLMNDKHVTSN